MKLAENVGYINAEAMFEMHKKSVKLSELMAPEMVAKLVSSQ